MREQNLGPVSEGYAANKVYEYFLGATPDLSFTGNVMIGLSNPINSGVNMCLDVATICNLSKELCRIEVCNAYRTLDSMEKVEHISMANLNCNPCSIPKGGIFFGVNQRPPKEKSWCTTIVREYETLNIQEDGLIIVAPGTSHYYMITSLVGLKKPMLNMSFKWWEEKIE